ncbi:hypothetical protein L1049_024810 [Liquidambar formosana]|uniref:DUF7815 domain-containing protein n=1 Tax=Liquidambar formosana TaxID=63359 RepID=A0AAP0RWN8_LIQFO
MAFEVPTDLIREVQILLRNHSGGHLTYDRDDPSLPPLPSLEESIAEFEPSPPYLRCKHCKGKLLRGLQSVICVYCGQEQSKEVPPEPIKFKSTFGCRWLLESLNLDGSEIVGPSIELFESNKQKSAPKDEFSLSDLLDLEIKWPTESEKINTSLKDKGPVQSKTSLNLVGVDLDNFFSEAKRDTVSNASGEQLGLNTQIKSTESNAFQGLENLSVFENGQPSAIAVRSTESESESGDRFSGWEAEFQSASSDGTQHKESNSFDPLGGSTVDLSAHMDAVFGPGKDLKDGERKEDSALPASMTDDRFEDDLWNNFNSGVSNKAEQFGATFNLKDDGNMDSTDNASSTRIDWIQDDQWQTTSTKVPDNKTIDGDDDSFDTWNDFTSSTSAQEPSNSSWKQTGNHITSSAGQTSDINLFSSTTNLQDMEFGSFSQPDLFSGAFSNQSGSTEVNHMWLAASVSDRIADENAKVGENSEHAGKGEDVLFATTRSKANDVEMLMSQMHDLSFMLESNLSIPKS